MPSLLDQNSPLQPRTKALREFFSQVHDYIMDDMKETLRNRDNPFRKVLVDYAESSGGEDSFVEVFCQYYLEVYCSTLFRFFDENTDTLSLSVILEDGRMVPFNRDIEGELYGYFFDTNPEVEMDGVLANYSRHGSLLSKITSDARKRISSKR